jgi:membrane-bound lytic murein transglycosylase B
MRKVSTTLTLLAAVLMFQFCSSSKKAASKEVAVTYDANVKPVIQSSCAPCHIAGKGNKKPLDNFADASSVADDIIARIQKSPEERGFMPFKHARLSDADIAVFVGWKKTGLKEK